MDQSRVGGIMVAGLVGVSMLSGCLMFANVGLVGRNDDLIFTP